MAELKTKLNNGDVNTFLDAVEDERKRKDCFELLNLMKELTGHEAKMWGDSIVGFGTYHYRYKTGREGDWMLTGFSPRKQNISVYIMCGFQHVEEHMQRLGKFKTGASCLYIKNLSDIDLGVLSNIIIESIRQLKEKYGS